MLVSTAERYRGDESRPTQAKSDRQTTVDCWAEAHNGRIGASPMARIASDVHCLSLEGNMMRMGGEKKGPSA